jgi:hypothetical protein
MIRLLLYLRGPEGEPPPDPAGEEFSLFPGRRTDRIRQIFAAAVQLVIPNLDSSSYSIRHQLGVERWMSMR